MLCPNGSNTGLEIITELEYPINMQTVNNLTWETLSLELDLLSTEDPHSIVPLLVGLNYLLRPDSDQDWCQRKINFMNYELAAKCEGHSEVDRFHILNDYFFDLKGFKASNIDQKCAVEGDFLIRAILSKKLGSPLIISLLYLHLCNKVDLPAYLINHSGMGLLKWVRSGKSSFIDLSRSGRILSEGQMIELLNEQNQTPCNNESCLDILPAKQVLKKYLKCLIDIYQRDKSPHQLHNVLNIILKIDPAHLAFLGQRALLRKDLGQPKDALCDLKRYFSFTDKNQAPPELQMAYYELQTQHANTSHAVDILH